MKNILAIDGGGVRSFIPLKILNEIEKRTGVPISELFEYFAGVSAGSIITGLVLVKDENGRQKYTTSQLLELFEKFTKSVFYYSYVDRVMSGFGLLGPKYSNDYLEKALNEYFGSLQLKDLIKPVCFISYDLNTLQPYYYSTRDTPDATVLDSILSSTAAPTYVPGAPTPEPTAEPTSSPTYLPGKPTPYPTVSPTDSPTRVPTSTPTTSPSSVPSSMPTRVPTSAPSSSPSSTRSHRCFLSLSASRFLQTPSKSYRGVLEGECPVRDCKPTSLSLSLSLPFFPDA
jgi:hypothetical protein